MNNASLNKYKLSRLGRKLQFSDDIRTLFALPREVPERVWAEIKQKEENDTIVFEIREEILDAALRTCYNRYMEKQNSLFTVHCAMQAWLKLIDWHFYRHDPGEDPTAYPPCHIPKRIESWTPDPLPNPSPKDAWCRHQLPVLDDCSSEESLYQSSNTSIEPPIVDDIPRQYWFPGRVVLEKEAGDDESISVQTNGPIEYIMEESGSKSEDLVGDSSELLQHVTDYSTEDDYNKKSTMDVLKTTTPAEVSLQGGGDSIIMEKPKKKLDRGKFVSRYSLNGKSHNRLQPLDKGSRSKISLISDCRLRNLRCETHYEVSAERMDTPPAAQAKRK